MSEHGGLWIDIKAIDDMSSRFLTYKKLLFGNRDELPSEVVKMANFATIGVNLTDICLNFRKGPSTNDDKIDCINGNSWSNKQWVHFKILEHKDKWAKVEATYTIYGEDDTGGDCSFTEIKKETGWVKALGDDGYPNIWFSVTAY